MKRLVASILLVVVISLLAAGCIKNKLSLLKAFGIVQNWELFWIAKQKTAA